MPRFGAFIPLLLFIFPGASSHCHTGTANECKKHTAFVPGHSLVGRGIDVTTMGRKGAELVDSSDWERPDGTCTLNLSSSVQQSAMGMMESAASPVQNDWTVGLDVPVKPKVNVQVALAGSHSKLASFVVDHTRMDKYSFVSHEVSCGYYRFRVSETPPLTSHFALALENLPDQYDSKSKVEYQHLISNYGTHYVSQLQLGGRARDVTAVRVCEAAMSSLTDDEIKDCLSMEAGVSIGMGSICPPGTQRSAHDPCSCVCPGDTMTNSMCCSRERGVGKLMVIVKKASGLWGDQSTATDAFVKVFFERREIRTGTIPDNNNPVWNVPFDFGTVHITSASKIRVQVWDEDKWNDDLLGSCDVPLKSGGPHQEDCYLNHGRIWFQYSLRCGPHLGGRSCFDYVSQPPQQSTAKGKEVEAFW
ncbi:perforin 1 [Chelydra serpentina]|uniref:Perforin 1 n=1 Tax=Chelydra serpentina TaxID=8475 RepID=A0A8T1RZG4_CHESE|nr:perforin 1 [Chelydra serpentina]